MPIEDESSFTLVIPSFEGTPFLRRLLDYLRAEGYPGHIVLADNSSGEHLSFVRACPGRYPELWLQVDEHEHSVGFLDKLVASIGRLQSRHVMLCAQDDFIVPAAVERLLGVLDADDGLACARGRVARFRLGRGAGEGVARESRVDFNKHPMLPHTESGALARVLAHMRGYSSTLYSVHRRALFLESLRATAAATRSVVFFQYLQSCITVAQGRIACTDDLFLARQVHAQSWSATMVEGGYEHWPLVVTSPQYSAYYAQFRDTLAGLLANIEGADGAAIGAKLDGAFIALLRRAFCQAYPTDPANEAFFARLCSAGTAENTLANRIARFSLPYEDTY